MVMNRHLIWMWISILLQYLSATVKNLMAATRRNVLGSFETGRWLLTGGQNGENPMICQLREKKERCQYV